MKVFKRILKVLVASVMILVIAVIASLIVHMIGEYSTALLMLLGVILLLCAGYVVSK